MFLFIKPKARSLDLSQTAFRACLVKKLCNFCGLNLTSPTGKDDIPKPVRTMITRWGSDALTCGSYSYIHVGEKGDDISTVAEPLYRDNTEVSTTAAESLHPEPYSYVQSLVISPSVYYERLINFIMAGRGGKSQTS